MLSCSADTPECYELVLRDAQNLSWSADADEKVLVVIGDSTPHEVGYGNPYNIDWRAEAHKLRERNIKVHGVQALSYSESTRFYKEVAQITGGHYFQLDQFALLTAFMIAVSYGAHSADKVTAYEQELTNQHTVSRSLNNLFNTLLGRAPAATTGAGASFAANPDVEAVPPGRFQVLRVDKELPIKEFAQANGLTFKTGKGFYEFTKPESISDGKEIVLMDKTTGDMFSGNKARDLLGLTAASAKDTFSPVALDRYRVFVQSTSVNRKLVVGTGFLYEVDSTV